jgi:NAD(P)H-hydrate epimerase
MKVTSAAQMREMDRQTIEDYGLPSIVLMENAALRVVDVLAQRFAPLNGKKIAVLCGKGSNGGDGLAIARHLATRFGAEAAVWLVAEPGSLSGDAATNYALAQKFGLTIRLVESDLAPLSRDLACCDLIVDALLGTGVKGGVAGTFAGVIEAANASGAPTVAVDLPSGLNTDTGAVEGACIHAEITVTFALPKFGLVDFPGVDCVGELIVADIGMPRPVMQAEHVHAWMTDREDVRAALPSRKESRDSNKGTFGHVFIYAGAQGFAGAPTLTAEGAARTGAGLVTLVVPQGVQTAVMSRVNPVIMTKGLPETEQGTFAVKALEAALKLAEKADAVAIGPGIGGTEDAETRQFVREFVSRCCVPLVVDADALNILAAAPDHGASVVRRRVAATILTPHPGEMGRLLGIGTKDVQADRRGVVERAASEFDCVVLLKGSRTLVADPEGNLHINITGNAGMATGGAGDTLTGIVGALLAAGTGAREAAAAGAYLHGRAGDIAARKQGGKAGLLAVDLIETLPQALAECEKEGCLCG